MMQTWRTTLGSLSLFVLLASGLAGIGHTTPIEARQQPAAIVPMQGVFYNLLARAGGTAALDLDLQPDSAAGYMNFTQLLGDTTMLCGAGSFIGSRTATGVHATFVSDDPDPGCGFDKNAIFTISAPSEATTTHFWGDYEAKNANGSVLLEAPGVFEAWAADHQPERVTYVGTFVNTVINRGGPVVLDLVLGTNTVSGFINFTNEPGQVALCGAGEFTGVRRSGGSLEFSFVSDDKDPGCGSSRTRFILESILSSDATAISGTYNTGVFRSGTFRVTRASKVFLPMLQR